MNISEFLNELNISERRKEEIVKVVCEKDIFSDKKEQILYILNLYSRSFNVKELKLFDALIKYSNLTKRVKSRALTKKEKLDLQNAIIFLEKNL